MDDLPDWVEVVLENPDVDIFSRLKGTPSKADSQAAIALYLRLQALGSPIPAQLQDYINRGLERVLEGQQTIFPVTKPPKITPHEVSFYAYQLTEKHNKTKSDANRLIASYFNVTDRTIENLIKEAGKMSFEDMLLFWTHPDQESPWSVLDKIIKQEK